MIQNRSTSQEQQYDVSPVGGNKILMSERRATKARDGDGRDEDCIAAALCYTRTLTYRGTTQ